MPIIHKNEDGTEVEVFTAEEVEAAKTAAIEAAQPPAPEPAPAPAPAQDPNNEPTVADALNKIKELEGALRARDIDAAAARFAGNDPEKQNAYKTAFNQLTGFEANPDGFAAQAAAAARLAFGSDQPVSVPVPAAVGPGRPVGDSAPLSTDKDKEIQAVLGIKTEDVTKYGDAATQAASS